MVRILHVPCIFLAQVCEITACAKALAAAQYYGFVIMGEMFKIRVPNCQGTPKIETTIVKSILYAFIIRAFL